MRMSDLDTALNELEMAPASPINEYFRTNILFQSGRESEAQVIFDRLEQTTAMDYPLAMASIYAVSGDLDSAFEWLETAYQQRDYGLAFILNNFWLEPFHSDPRFPVFLEKMGLREYWEAMQ
jgi:hypothetical protein